MKKFEKLINKINENKKVYDNKLIEKISDNKYSNINEISKKYFKIKKEEFEYQLFIIEKTLPTKNDNSQHILDLNFKNFYFLNIIITNNSDSCLMTIDRFEKLEDSISEYERWKLNLNNDCNDVIIKKASRLFDAKNNIRNQVVNIEQKLYNYRIYNNVYDDIKSGKKNIEFRLLNEKSESIKNGDLIKFSVLYDENKSLIVQVIDKIFYDNLDDLWNDKDIISSNSLNYTKEEFIDIFNNIFGKEQVKNSKIVGIKFNLKSINE